VCFQVQNEFTRRLPDPLPYCPREESEEHLLYQLFIAKRGSSRAATRRVIHCPRGEQRRNSYSLPQRGTRGEAVILLPQRGTRGSSRQSLDPLLDPLLGPLPDPLLDQSLDQGQRIIPDLFRDQSAFRSSSFPYSTGQLSIRRGEEEATTRPIDHLEHRGKGADFAAPCYSISKIEHPSNRLESLVF